jgi:hypothetical protein
MNGRLTASGIRFAGCEKMPARSDRDVAAPRQGSIRRRMILANKLKGSLVAEERIERSTLGL